MELLGKKFVDAQTKSGRPLEKMSTSMMTSTSDVRARKLTLLAFGLMTSSLSRLIAKMF
jgi:hypothetical protein